MPTKPCEVCGNPFSFKPYRAATARFCSGSCRATWCAKNLPGWGGLGKMKLSAIGNKHRAGLRPTNAFKPGHATWNKDVKGIHLSPASEYKPGVPHPERRAPIGEVRTRKVRGHRRAFVKIAHPNKWKLRAVKTWEDANGPVPKGKIVHHVDRDPLHDDIGNLECLTRAEHINEHRND